MPTKYTQSVLIRNGSIRNASRIYGIFKKQLAELSKRNGQLKYPDFLEMALMRGFKIRNICDDKILLILTFIPTLKTYL